MSQSDREIRAACGTSVARSAGMPGYLLFCNFCKSHELRLKSRQ